MSHRAEGLNDIFENNVTIRKNLNTTSGQISTTPVQDFDIVNKLYVDGEIPAGIVQATATWGAGSDNMLIRADGTLRQVQDSGATLSDQGDLTLVGNFQIGSGVPFTDPTFTIIGDSNTVTFTWKEDENYLTLNKEMIIITGAGSTPSVADVSLMIQNNALTSSDCTMIIVGGNAAKSRLWFGDIDSASIGTFEYDHVNNRFLLRISGSNEIYATTTSLYPVTADGMALGSSTNEWEDLYVTPPSSDSEYVHLTIDSNNRVTKMASSGASGSFVDNNGNTVTVVNGIITKFT